MTKKTPADEAPREAIARNPKATHDYHILDSWEAGIVLTGTEVKSLRHGKASIKEAYARIRGGEVFLEGMNITPYAQGNRYNHDPVRSRKLLLHRRELSKLSTRIRERGFVAIPLSLYFRNGYVKVELGLGKGRTHEDRRQAVKDRDVKRELQRIVRTRRR